jgi:hypothetical protein
MLVVRRGACSKKASSKSSAPFPSFSEAVKPTRAADTLPMVTAMLSQARKVRSLAAMGRHMGEPSALLYQWIMLQ